MCNFHDFKNVRKASKYKIIIVRKKLRNGIKDLNRLDSADSNIEKTFFPQALQKVGVLKSYYTLL